MAHEDGRGCARVSSINRHSDPNSRGATQDRRGHRDGFPLTLGVELWGLLTTSARDEDTIRLDAGMAAGAVRLIPCG
jgi:hypothetical protein